ncbi:MAG: ribosomal RNA small subunit methyltransferase A [Chitinophagaceae bacterium]|nr:ribosomal RNA small subunit methyltransferase A [Chitinophagaceae bacterium]
MYTLKKSLGQHFLIDESISRRIVESVLTHSPARLIEVGPGGGALTKYLLELKNIEFKAVELDQEKVDYLLKTYPAIAGKVINHDFLHLEKPFEGPFSIIGNFPYNVSTEILFKILEWKEDVQCVVGMLQKEVAQRIAAREGTKIYGVTSVLLQAFFDVEYLFEVHENAFNPPPAVKSAVIRLTPAVDKPDIKSEKKLALLVKTAFNQRRKTLRNGVRGLFKPELLEDAIFNKRAEQLSLKDFAALTHLMN